MNTEQIILKDSNFPEYPSGVDGNIVIAMDIGGTKIKIALVNHDKIVCKASIDAESANGLTGKLPVIENAVNEMMQQCSVGKNEIKGVGISMPGIIDSKQKKVLSIDNKFNDVVNLDLNKWIDDIWQTELQIENDARCALIGEWQYGKGKGYDNVVLMTIGTGVGSSAVIEGKYCVADTSRRVVSADILPLIFMAANAIGGNIGCVETEASTWNIESIAKLHKLYKASVLSLHSKIDFETIFRCAKEGDVLAKELRNICVNVWSAAAVNLIHAYDPEVLVVGGGVMASADFIIPYMQQKTDAHAWTPWGKVKVEAADNINAAALLGAAWLVYKN